MEQEPWSYEKAFVRNLGLISREEQEKLRCSRVAIIGQGGVGGVHLVTLARLGIGKFTIADGDAFEPANFNRQYGATVSALGRLKVEVMEKILHDINPEAELTVFPEYLGPHNADAFLEATNLLLDGIDAFEIDIRRLLFRKAAEQGIFSVTAGPVGFGAAWLVFDPAGMKFDDYFDFQDEMDITEKFAAFIVGLAPGGIHRSYIDASYVDIEQKTAPSSGLACQLAAGAAGAEILKILLRRGPVHAAPVYHQFDPYKNRFIHGRLVWGNKGPLQQLKRRQTAKMLRRLTEENKKS